MRRRSVAATLFAIVFAATLVPTPATAEPDAAAHEPCPGFQYVEHQGWSCPVPGGWEVLLDDGTRLLTHGPDPAPPAMEPDVVAASAATPPTCVQNGTVQPMSLLIYAVPADRTDRYDAVKSQLRALINESNGRLRAEAARYSFSTNYIFACDADGLVSVAHARLPTTTADDDFSSIVRDLRNQGYGQSHVKHWVWYDASVSGIGGQGHFWSDDRLAANNANNNGGQFALTYGYFSSRILMHENGHNMGAVQNSAPNSSGGAHCNDGYDVMCYADGGSKSAYRTDACNYEAYDCGGNDYFNPHPPAGSYLASHWNLAHRYNKWFDFSNRAPLAPTISCMGNPTQPAVSVTCRFVVDDESSGIHLDIDWGDGSRQRYPETGTVPPGGMVQIAHAWDAFGLYNITATATDNADPPLTGPARSYPMRVACGFERAATVLVGLQGVALEPWSARVERGIHEQCAGRPFVVEHSFASEWRTCWLGAADADLGCQGMDGTVPEGATAVRLVLVTGVNGAYFLKVH